MLQKKMDESGTMEKVRIRIEFEDSEILSKPHRSEELERSWILLNPQLHKSISDLVSYIIRSFDLHLSCPNGIILYMEGFVLPPFESTSILKDKDIICVRKKGAKLLGGYQSVKEKDNNLLLLANEEFEKETGGYLSEEDEDEENEDEKTMHVERSPVSKKRECSKDLKSSKKRKHPTRNSDSAENVTQSTLNVIDEPGSSKKRKKRRCSEVSEAVGNEVKNVAEAEISKGNNKDLEQVGEEVQDIPKVPSRSARRKKAKRQWLRELAKAEKEVLGSHPKELEEESMVEKTELVSQSPTKVIDKEVTGHLLTSRKDDAKDELVPVVIKPGHIRFEVVEDDEPVQQTQVSKDSYKWNGITSKKKGQKWGQENSSSLRMKVHTETLTVDEEEETLTVHTETLTVDGEEENEEEKETTVNECIEFEKLPPLSSSPKKGDVIAYRLLELTSSWTPEMSSFRVGRVSSYDPKSTRVLLMPVPKYPIDLEKVDDEEDVYDETMKPDYSLYNEDQSLEIEFSSLVDVRIVEQSKNSSAKTAGNDNGNEKDLANSLPTKSDKGKPAKKLPENGEVKKSVWDEISEAIKAKKKELHRQYTTECR